MLIGELAQRVNVPIDTIRFYEKQGLLDGNHFVRRRNGYKEYNEAAVKRLELILCAKRLRFTLKEIKSFVNELESNQLSPQQKKAALESKITIIDNQITELKETKYYLQQRHQHLSAAKNQVISDCP